MRAVSRLSPALARPLGLELFSMPPRASGRSAPRADRKKSSPATSATADQSESSSDRGTDGGGADKDVEAPRGSSGSKGGLDERGPAEAAEEAGMKASRAETEDDGARTASASSRACTSTTSPERTLAAPCPDRPSASSSSTTSAIAAQSESWPAPSTVLAPLSKCALSVFLPFFPLFLPPFLPPGFATEEGALAPSGSPSGAPESGTPCGGMPSTSRTVESSRQPAEHWPGAQRRSQNGPGDAPSTDGPSSLACEEEGGERGVRASREGQMPLQRGAPAPRKASRSAGAAKRVQKRPDRPLELQKPLQDKRDWPIAPRGRSPGRFPSPVRDGAQREGSLGTSRVVRLASRTVGDRTPAERRRSGVVATHAPGEVTKVVAIALVVRARSGRAGARAKPGGEALVERARGVRSLLAGSSPHREYVLRFLRSDVHLSAWSPAQPPSVIPLYRSRTPEVPAFSSSLTMVTAAEVESTLRAALLPTELVVTDISGGCVVPAGLVAWEEGTMRGGDGGCGGAGGRVVPLMGHHRRRWCRGRRDVMSAEASSDSLSRCC